MKLFLSLVAILFTLSGVRAQDPSPSPTPIVITADKVGINTLAPTTLLDLKVPYAVDTTASAEMIRFTPKNGHAPFQIYHRTTMFGGNQTNSVGFGFLPDGDVQGSPGCAFLLEDEFGTAPDPVNLEFHLQCNTPGSGPIRPITGTVDRATGSTFFAISARAEFYSGGNVVKINPAEVLTDGTARHRGTVSFETNDNVGNAAKQIKILPFPSDTSQSVITFGPVTLKPTGNGLAVYKDALYLTPGYLFAGRYYDGAGHQVVSSQCAAIPNSTGGTDDTRAINAILACMRSHGLVAP